MKRFKIYKIEEVLPFIAKKLEGQKHPEKDYDGHLVKMDSDRYFVFATKGTKCVSCGIEGSFFALEQNLNPQNPNRWHFNLYAIDLSGKEVLMTKDHIVSKNNGGNDSIDNYQPMCFVCNTKKSLTEQLLLNHVVQKHKNSERGC